MMPIDPSKETSPSAPLIRSHSIPWIASTCIAVATLGLVAFLKTCRSTEAGAKILQGTAVAVKDTVREASEVMAKFKTGTITRTFTEQNVEISSTKGDILELATTRQTENFFQEDSKHVLWDLVDLGTTSSEIRVPVTFRYHLRLSDPWRLATRENVCLVLAPMIRPSQPPAIHTSEMVKNTSSGWARFNGDANLAALERSITPELEMRAFDPGHKRLVREACRQSVAEYVKAWLLREDRWREDRLSSVVVVFPDETSIGSDEALEALQHEPTVRLENRNLPIATPSPSIP